LLYLTYLNNEFILVFVSCERLDYVMVLYWRGWGRWGM